jgi:uncharacterized protein
LDAELFVGEVMHARLGEPAYRFRYGVFSLLLDIDRLHQATGRLRWFSRNRFNLISFHDRDHLAEDCTLGLREWAERVLAARGIDLEGGRIRLLCFPRVLGFVFNPLSIWYCEHKDGRLRAIICEVRNTFGERHCYVLPEAGWDTHLRHPKRFHVSPFMGMEGEYTFRFTQPRETLDIAIIERMGGRRVFVARQHMERTALTDGALWALMLVMPLMTLKVVLAIHWQALKIWLRGGKFHRKPPPPSEEVSHDVR